MAAMREYASIGSEEYFRLTEFEKTKSRTRSYEELTTSETALGELRIERVEITRELAAKILTFMIHEEMITRGGSGSLMLEQNPQFSSTAFTTRFALHVVAGKRGGWYVLDDHGREPPIKNEFIECGPKKKSGGRRDRYRRELSSSEQNQVDYLKSKTPPLETVYRWIIRKYPDEVINVDFRFLGDENDLPY